jgi:YD repeat-containing protein
MRAPSLLLCLIASLALPEAAHSNGIDAREAAPPDPEQGLYARWDQDPMPTGTMLGDFYLPHGPIRRVTWQATSTFGGLGDDPPGWETRKVIEYNRAGRATVVETRSLGGLEWRSSIARDKQGRVVRVISTGASDREERCTYDSVGRPLTRDCLIPKNGVGSIRYIYYDYAHQVIKEELGVDRGWYEVRRDTFDDAGRLLESTDVQSCKRYVYDTENRLIAIASSLSNGSTWQILFAYDDHGRLVSRSRLNADGSARTVCSFTWSSDGDLTSSEVVEAWRDPPTRRVTTYRGRDRIVTEGDWVYAYEDDAYGNWVYCYGSYRSEPDTGSPSPPMLRRIIEYYE